MKHTTALISALTLIAVGASAADHASEELTKAAKALADKPNYSWKTTVEVPGDAQFKPGPTEGMVEKDGYMVVTSQFGPNTSQTVKKGEHIALTNRDGGWDSIADVESDEQGFGRFRAMMARNLQTPAEQAKELASGIKDLKKDGDMYSGTFSEDTAKGLFGFGRGGNGGGPNISGAKASGKFWVKDGVLSKMEIKVEGTMDFNGNEMAIDRTSTTEIKEVGSTKVAIPDDAKEKLK